MEESVLIKLRLDSESQAASYKTIKFEPLFVSQGSSNRSTTVALVLGFLSSIFVRKLTKSGSSGRRV